MMGGIKNMLTVDAGAEQGMIDWSGLDWDVR